VIGECEDIDSAGFCLLEDLNEADAMFLIVCRCRRMDVKIHPSPGEILMLT
jgi:hypothetical protein